MDSLKVGNAICEILTTDDELKSVIGNKVFPLVANQDTLSPFIVYKRSSTMPTSTKDRFIISYDSTIEILAVSDDYDEAVDIAYLIDNALKGKKGIIAGINIAEIEYESDDEEYLEGAFIEKLTYKIKVK